MALVDDSYFINEISLPNLDKKPNTVISLIEKYEKEILISLLGYELYREFTEGLTQDPVDQKWIDLRDGKEFDFDFDGRTITTKWEGLVNVEKESLIAYFSYYKMRERNKTTTTSVNEVRGKLENSETVNEARKMINAWKNLIKLYGSVCYSIDGFNISGLSTYQNRFYFDKYQRTYDTYNDWPSAFNFLNARRDDYPNWIFSPLPELNDFGL